MLTTPPNTAMSVSAIHCASVSGLVPTNIQYQAARFNANRAKATLLRQYHKTTLAIFTVILQVFNERHEQLTLGVKGVKFDILLVYPHTLTVSCPHVTTQVAVMILVH